MFRVLSFDSHEFRAPDAVALIETQTSPQRLGDLVAGLFLVELASGTIAHPDNWPSDALDQGGGTIATAIRRIPDCCR